MKRIKRLKVINIKKLNEDAVSFELEEEEVNITRIFEEYESTISDLIDKGVLTIIKD